jgi:hypothetical protein
MDLGYGKEQSGETIECYFEGNYRSKTGGHVKKMAVEIKPCSPILS